MLDFSNLDKAYPGVRKTCKLVSGFLEPLTSLPPAFQPQIDRTTNDLEKKFQKREIFRLFGTSGIRGVFKRMKKPITTYSKTGTISPKLAYFYGRAYGKMTVSRGLDPKIWLAMDPRKSSLEMAIAVIAGLSDEGIDVMFNGVSSTPSAAFYPNSIVITASHNPIQYNGIKAFIRGTPITYETEWEIEKCFRALEILEEEGCFPKASEHPGTVIDNTNEVYDTYLKHIRKEAAREGLLPDNPGGSCPLGGCYMPLDLAYGSSASVRGNNLKLSPQIKSLLETGLILVGYGTEQNPEKINYRIGAAYPYGETPEKITERELTLFAAGQYGYGEDRITRKPHYRSFYFPASHKFSNPSLPGKGLILEDGITVFLEADRDKPLAKELDKELENLILLPACSVDCDEDRFLATSPELSGKPVPFLSGDTMIILFALSMKDCLEEVVFTVESGLWIGKFLESEGIKYKEVTVGDRAIADYLNLKENPHPGAVSIGGEPSGHMMFSQRINGCFKLVDDPIITQLRILGIMRRENKGFDQLINEVQGDLEEVYTARKPEAWAGDPCGISLWEKSRLEAGNIKHNGKRVYFELNQAYLGDFIPRYIEVFAEGYLKAYYKSLAANREKHPNAVFSVDLEKFSRMISQDCILLKDQIESVELGDIIISEGEREIERLEITLRLTKESWAGINDINLSFRSKDRDGKPRLAGAMVSRNSGTLPKNSAYHKLWYRHYPTGFQVSSQVIMEVTRQMAEKRARITDNYVHKLRNR